MKKSSLNQWIERNQYGILAAILTAILGLIIYTISSRLIGGSLTFCHSDMMTQYVSFSELFWRNLLQGKSLTYTFQVTLGTPGVPLYTYYSLSPFHILFFLIKDENTAGAIVVFCKLALAAYTFWHFQKHILKRDGIGSTIFSLCYALCSYSVSYYYNVHTLDGVYMLPIIIEGIVLLINEGKYKKLLLSYAYLFIICFYAGYMIGIFSFVIFLTVMILTYGKNLKKYCVTCAKFAGSVFLAALLGSVCLLPTALYVVGNISHEGAGYQGVNLNILDVYGNLFIGQMQTQKGIYPLFYCGLISLLLVPIFFIDKEISWKKKILAGVLIGFLLFCTLTDSGYIMIHCFDAPNGSGYRFAYFFSFVLLSCASCEWGTKKKYSFSILACWIFVNLGIYYLSYFLQKKKLSADYLSSSMMKMGVNAIFLFVLLCLLVWLQRKEGKRTLCELLLAFVIVCELVINGYYCVSRLGVALEESKQISVAFDEVSERAINEIKAQDQGIYRIYFSNADELNDAARNDYMALDYFTSIENKNLRLALMHLGYYTTPRLIFDEGGTDFTRMIFAQKYHIGVNDSAYIADPTIGEWTQNPQTLSLGFMVSNQVVDVTMDPLNAFENQNRLISAMVGERQTLFIPYNGDLLCTSDNMQLGTLNGYYWIEKVQQDLPDASVLIQVPDEYHLPMYVYLSQEESVKDETTPLVIPKSEYIELLTTVSFLATPHLMELQLDDENRYGVELKMVADSNTQGAFKDIHFCAYDQGVVETAYEALKDNQLEITEMGNSRIEGTVTATEEKPLLFTSIPYDENWTVMVDGIQSNKIAVVDGAFLAIPLTPGTHSVVITYQNTMNQVGLGLSGIGVLIFVGILVLERNRSSKKD